MNLQNSRLSVADHAFSRSCPRTDLACEAGRACVSSEDRQVSVGAGLPVTVCRSVEADGGRFTTISCGPVTIRGEEELRTISRIVGEELSRMAAELVGRPLDASCRILAVGLGNPDMTPDAIGPGTLRRMTVTRHLREYDPALYEGLGCCELAALSPGVLGQTGVESGELVRAAAELTRPHLIVAVDALAARSCERLSSTIQLSSRGISPGAGIGNRRIGLCEETVGCPVLGVGVPTVVDSATLVWDALEQAGMTREELPSALAQVLETGRSFIVSPKDCDSVVEMICRVLAGAMDLAFGIGET